MDEYIGKKYKLQHSENFEEYLKFIGIGFVYRKIILALSPVTVLTKNEDGSYTSTANTPLRSIVTTFKIGEEFTEERPDGTKMQSLILLDGTQLIHTQTESCGRKSTHIRQFTANTMTVITTAEGWNGTCKRIYELID